MKKVIFFLINLLLLNFTLEAQYNIATSDLRHQLANPDVKTVVTELPADQNKSNLTMGTSICVNYEGELTNAMVIGVGFGDRGDAYKVSLRQGKHRGTRLELLPNEIAAVGECVQEYLEAPTKAIPDDFDVDAFEKAIIKEVNIMRSNPSAYAEEMRKLQFEDYGPAHNQSSIVVLGKDPMYYCSHQSCKEEYEAKLQVAINHLSEMTEALSELSEDRKLWKASQLLAADDGEINGMRHEDSKGRDPWERGKVAGYESGIRGECLGGGHKTAAGVVISFLLSPPHRDILLKEKINEIGVDVHKHGLWDRASFRTVIIVGQNDQPKEKEEDKDNNTNAEADSGENASGSTNSSRIEGVCRNVKQYIVYSVGDINKGARLTKNHCVISENKKFALTMDESKLFIAKVQRTYQQGAEVRALVCTNQIIWSPKLVNWGVKKNRSQFTMNTDCNLCFDSQTNQSWCATTGRDDNVGLLYRCARANLTNDGRLVIYASNGNELWSNTQVPDQPALATVKYQASMNLGDRLLENEKLVSANGRYQLRGTSKGDFVLESLKPGSTNPDQVLYVFPISGQLNNPPKVSVLSFNRDGNLCIQSKQNKGYCVTNGKDSMARKVLYQANKLILTDTGRLVLQSKTGQEIWSVPERKVLGTLAD